MRSLLVVAHGSRRAASNDEVRELTRRLAEGAGEHYRHVECAFLELADPSIPDGLRNAISVGATEIIVLPYFLSAGRHVVTDIPDEVEKVRVESPSVSIVIAPYLGAAESLGDLLLDHARLP